MCTARSVFCILLLSSFLSSRHVARAQTAPGGGYWHAVGPQLLDSAGQTVRIVGVTWYGMETANWVPAGLDIQRYTTILDQVKMLGVFVLGIEHVVRFFRQ